MPKQMYEREKILKEVAAIKKVGLLMLDVPPEKRSFIINAVLGQAATKPTVKKVKRKYNLKKKAGRKKTS